MGLDFTGNTTFGPGGSMNVSSQIAGLQDLNMPNVDLSGLAYLMRRPKPEGPHRYDRPAEQAAMPTIGGDMIQYRTGITPQGVRYRTPMNGPNAGQVEIIGGMPERFGMFVGAAPGYPSAGGGR